MKAFLLSLSVLLVAIVVAATATPDCDPIDESSTFRVFHINSPCSPFRSSYRPSWEDSVLQMQSADKARLQYLSSLVARRSDVPLASGTAVTKNPTYVVRTRIGTPPQTLFTAFDTSYDVAWIPCSGCDGCASTTFDGSRSSTFKALRCGAPQCSQVPNPSCGGAVCVFNVTYGGSVITATLAQDTVALSADSISGYTFGCVRKTTGVSFPAQGLLGLGRGPLSLVSQAGEIYRSTFSYCLPSYKSVNFTGSLRLGPVAQPKRIKTTLLLGNPRRSSLYYVNLVGIRVGGRVVNIPPSAFAYDPVSGAGTVFDSGTVFTTLVKPAYTAVRDELRRRMGTAVVSSLGGFDTCYNIPIVVPTITFMFSGMNVTLPQDNFLIHSSSGTVSCLAMAAAADGGVNSRLNVIANFQQQNHRVLIDVPNSKLAVAREACT